MQQQALSVRAEGPQSRAAVVSLPSGAAAFATKGQTEIMLMVLTSSHFGGDGVESVVRSVHGKGWRSSIKSG